MPKHFKLKIIFIILSGAILAGCSFSNADKKTEINLNNNSQTVNYVDDSVKQSNDDKDTSRAVDSEAPPIKSSEKDSAASSASSTKSITSPVSVAPAVPQTEAPAFKITDRLVSWGFTKVSSRKIDTIIIHSSYNAVGDDPHDLDDIINKEYKPAGVSPHYIIDRQGKVYRLVKDQNIAYHAGVSKVPDGRTNVNDFSLGIEVVETDSESPSSAQYSALKSLINYLEDKYRIKYILGHSDIASGRKTDPWNFSWSKVGGKKK